METFEYAAKVVKKQAEERKIEITNFYMIGDNPRGDILGANQKNWRSILVRSGIYKPGCSS